MNLFNLFDSFKVVAVGSQGLPWWVTLIFFLALGAVLILTYIILVKFPPKKRAEEQPEAKALGIQREKDKKSFKLPFYVVKRMGLPKWVYWCIRVGGILLAFLAAGLTSNMLVPGSFGKFFSEMALGCFDPDDFSTIIELLISFSVILIIAMALTPAFKMKFWNIGAEGQVLVGCLVAAAVAKFMDAEDPVIWVVAALGAMAAGILWSVLPAIFKAFFNTNETLFSLMLNYIAFVIVDMCINIWIKSGTQTFGTLSQGLLPEIFDDSGTIVILFAGIIFAILLFYIKFSKQGYEINVVGESLNTAKYVGINVKKVIIRTMIICGAVCGFLGFLLVCGVEQTLNKDLVGGQGFTGVLIAWLGHFDPLEIALFSFLSAIFDVGSARASTAIGISSIPFKALCTSIFFFFIIACEFFSNYEIKMHKKERKEAK